MAAFVAGQGRSAMGEVVPSEMHSKMAWTTRIPVGVVGMITPWNFPVAIPSWKIFPALLAGNGVVMKPSELAPQCGIAFVEACIEAGIPADLLQVVHGGRRARRCPRRPPRDRRRVVHRLGPHRPQGGGRGHGGRAEARQPRARRQERHGRARRRRPRPRRRRGALRRLRQRRPALHVHLAPPPAAWHQRAPSIERLVERTARAAARRPARPEHRRRPGHQPRSRLAGSSRWSTPPSAEGASAVTGGHRRDDVAGLRGRHLRRADDPHRGEAEPHGGPPGGLRAGAVGDRGGRPRRRRRRRELRRVRPQRRRLHAGHQRRAAGGRTPSTPASPTSTPRRSAPRSRCRSGARSTPGNGYREAGSRGIEQFSQVKTVYIDYSGRLQRAQIDNRED